MGLLRHPIFAPAAAREVKAASLMNFLLVSSVLSMVSLPLSEAAEAWRPAVAV